MINVRQVMTRGELSAPFVERLEALGSQAPDQQALADASADPRLARVQWRAVLAVELLLLLRWAARRYLRDPAAGPPALLDRPSEALVLLPGYGFGLHVLRRAVPFAALGVATTVSVAPGVLDDARQPVAVLARGLGLEGVLGLSSEPPADLVRRFARAGQPIFVTGRQETYLALAAAYPDASLFGATGRCALVMSRTRQGGADLRRRLHGTASAVSCSRPGPALHCADLSPGAPASAHSPDGTGPVSTVVEAVRRSHPSVILVPHEDEAEGDLPATIGGYTVLACDADGEPRWRDGFGRDPVCGWPGDYVV